MVLWSKMLVNHRYSKSCSWDIQLTNLKWTGVSAALKFCVSLMMGNYYTQYGRLHVISSVMQYMQSPVSQCIVACFRIQELWFLQHPNLCLNNFLTTLNHILWYALQYFPGDCSITFKHERFWFSEAGSMCQNFLSSWLEFRKWMNVVLMPWTTVSIRGFLFHRNLWKHNM